MSKNKYILPFKGTWYVEYGGTKKKNSHSWNIIGQRYAYDFEIRKENLPYHGDLTKNENYYSYLENIYAPSDGWVVEIVDKYEDIITILLSQFWGNEARNKMCKEQISTYINKIEEIVKQGIEKKEIKQGNPQIIASEIYGLICSSLVYKIRNNGEIDIMKLYKEFENTIIEGLKIK